MTDDDIADVEPRFDAEQVPPPSAVYEGSKPVQIDPREAAAPSRRREVSGGGGGDPRVAKALRYAGAELRRGVCEEGKNGGIPFERYVQWFGSHLGPSPWCAFFVSWCWDMATDRNRRTPWENPGYVPSIHAWASSHGKLVGQPEPGDLFGDGGDHIGWVLTPGRSTFTTIEGNTPRCVESLERSVSGLWFARIA
jgi:hypothetical protein